MSNLEEEIRAALNRFSAENASNTPDFILAAFLLGCLAAWNKAQQARADWYGQTDAPGQACEPPKGPGE